MRCISSLLFLSNRRRRQVLFGLRLLFSFPRVSSILLCVKKSWYSVNSTLHSIVLLIYTFRFYTRIPVQRYLISIVHLYTNTRVQCASSTKSETTQFYVVLVSPTSVFFIIIFLTEEKYISSVLIQLPVLWNLTFCLCLLYKHVTMEWVWYSKLNVIWPRNAKYWLIEYEDHTGPKRIIHHNMNIWFSDSRAYNNVYRALSYLVLSKTSTDRKWLHGPE